jgi:hypothetical protein
MRKDYMALDLARVCALFCYTELEDAHAARNNAAIKEMMDKLGLAMNELSVVVCRMVDIEDKYFAAEQQCAQMLRQIKK